MKTNVEKVLERDQKLSELDDRAGKQNYVLHFIKNYNGPQTLKNAWNLYAHLSDALQQGASQFEQQAGKLKRKFWLQNLKVSARSMPRERRQWEHRFLCFQMMIIMGVIGLVIVAILVCK
jgi:vesicle-associated membrane protein 2